MFDTSPQSQFKALQRMLGFTIIELMMTLAVAAILITIAIPSFRSMIISNNIITHTNEFVGTISYARSEAIRRGKSVTICKSSSGTACLTGGGTYWDSGWIAHIDLDSDGTVDANEVLRVWPKLPDTYTLRSSEFTDLLRYNPLGTANNSGSFAICHNSSEQGAKAIIITPMRPRLGEDSDNNQIPENDSGEINSCESP